jgi:ATP-dependent Clp protease ATP-binding subunit ClpA
LDALERGHVADMLGEGATWADIAEPLGITRQAAHHRHRQVPPAKAPAAETSAEVQRILVTGAARGTVRLAREEAAAQGASTVGTEHLLLALTRTAPEPVARLLADSGIDEHALRSTLHPTIVGTAEPSSSNGGFTRYAREVLEGSLREAVDRGEGYIAADHLLLALLRNPAGGAAQTLDALGVQSEMILAALAGQR